MNIVQEKSEPRPRRVGTKQDRQRDLALRLIAAAGATIARAGLAELRARDLADAAGCSLGAIYGVFPTLDALIMAVNERTLAALQSAIEAGPWPEAPEAQLCGFAATYLAFASQHPLSWAALFEHRLPPGQTITSDYAARQASIFARIAEPIARLCPGLSEEQQPLVAQTIFSAVHGIVQLGLQQKLAPLPLPLLETQLRWTVEALARGFALTPTRR